MAVKYEYTYDVRGGGEFPIDMLRYDRCFPATEGDSKILEQSFSFGYGQQRRLKLRSEKEPTIKRWSSYGWDVIPATFEKRKV